MRERGEAGSSSTEPVLVVPALAMTKPGRRPAARSAPAAAATVSAVRRSVVAGRQHPHVGGREAQRQQPAPDRRVGLIGQVGHAGAVHGPGGGQRGDVGQRAAADQDPSVSSGSPSSSRSQSSTTSSTVAGPEPPFHEAAIALKPVPIHSPSTPVNDDGPGTRAK